MSSALRTFRVVPRRPPADERFDAGWDWLSIADPILEVLASRDPGREAVDAIVSRVLAGICEAARVDLVAILGVKEGGRAAGAGDVFELQRVASARGLMPEPPGLAILRGEPLAPRVAAALRDLGPLTFAVEAPLANAGDESLLDGWVVALGHGEGADEDDRVSRARAVLEQVGWVLALALSRGARRVRTSATARETGLSADEVGLCARALARPGRGELPASPPAHGGGLTDPRVPAPDPAAPRPVDENVQFTVYRPRRIPPGQWSPLLAFAHLAERRTDGPEDAPDPVEEVRRQARQVLGDRAAAYAATTEDSGEAIPREGEITFVLDAPDLEVNPRQRSFRWLEEVHREEFRIRAPAALDGRTVRGALHVYLGALLVADVSLAIRVGGAAAPPATPDAEADRARPYRRIFPSYSHRDERIVQQVEAYARTMGDEYLRDVTHLRAGEVWDDRLMDFIRTADVFQLFWSRNSMRSPWVRREWEYALSLGRAHFVRPTYWETPMPEAPERDLPPAPLKALHFQRLPVAEDATGSDPPASGTSSEGRSDWSEEPRVQPGSAPGRGTSAGDDTVVLAPPMERPTPPARAPEMPAPSRPAPRPARRASPWRIPTTLAALLLIGVIGGSLMWRQVPMGNAPPMSGARPTDSASAPLQAVSPDGRLVAALDREGQIRIAPRAGGDALVIATALRPPDVRSMRFSSDGSRIVCELQNGTTVEWDARTGVRVATAAPPRTPVA